MQKKPNKRVQSLIQGLLQEVAADRAHAAMEILKIGLEAKEAVPVLQEISEDSDPVVYWNAQEALDAILAS